MKKNRPSRKQVLDSGRVRTASRRERERKFLESYGFQSVEGLMGALMRGEVIISVGRRPGKDGLK